MRSGADLSGPTDTVTRLILMGMEAPVRSRVTFVVVDAVGPLAATRIEDAAPDGHEGISAA